MAETAPMQVWLNHDPADLGAYVCGDEARLPVARLPLYKVVPFEPPVKFASAAALRRVARMAQVIGRGESLPPILVRPFADRFQVIDGHHRRQAHRWAGSQSIDARIVAPSCVLEINRSDDMANRNPIAAVADPHGVLAPSEVAIRDIIADLDAVASAMEAVWGIGELRTRVSAEWRDRFDAQARKLDAAIETGLEAEIRLHAGAMARAWRKLDEIVRAAGQIPGPKGAPAAGVVMDAFPGAEVAGVKGDGFDWRRGDEIPF